MPNINLAKFEMPRSILDDLSAGFPTNKPKLIFKIQLYVTNPANSKLLVYYAKKHAHYAEESSPIAVLNAVGHVSINEILIIGNSEATVKKLLKQNGQPMTWSWIRLTPVLRRGYNTDLFEHLAFKVEFLTAEKVVINEYEPVYSNPSPPAKPSEEEI